MKNNNSVLKVLTIKNFLCHITRLSKSQQKQKLYETTDEISVGES